MEDENSALRSDFASAEIIMAYRQDIPGNRNLYRALPRKEKNKMGAPLTETDHETQTAIKELSGLSRTSKMYLSHHLRNSLQVIDAVAYLGRFEDIHALVLHMREDLERVGL